MFMVTRMIVTLLCLFCIIYGIYLQYEGQHEENKKKATIKRIAGYAMVIGGFAIWVLLKHFGIA